MRRAGVLLGFLLATFLPGVFLGREHLARGFADSAGRFSFEGRLPPRSGVGSEAPVALRLDVLRSEFRLDLGGAVDPGTLRVAISWRGTWFDDDGAPHEGERGILRGAETRLDVDEAAGVVSGPSAALSMARGPAVLRGGCGSGRESFAVHEFAFRRDGAEFAVSFTVWYTRRGNRVVTVDAGAAP